MDESTYSNILQELTELKNKVTALDSRVENLESSWLASEKKQIVQARQASGDTIPLVPVKEGGTAHAMEATARPATGQETPVDQVGDQQAKSGDTQLPELPKQKDQSLETRIGLYWLNRLGIISLVIGVVFLLLYSVQYFGPPVKLLIGYLIAAGLIVFGERTAANAKRSWYGHGLMGGGWGLAYFTAYAMYFIPELKVISVYAVELVILAIICGAALVRAIHFKAEIIAVLSVVLSVLSVSFSGAGLISNVAIIVVAIVCSLVALRQSWYRLLYLGIFASYCGYSAASYPFSNPVTGGSTSLFTTKSLFLFAYWLVFSVAVYFGQEETPSDRRKLVIAAVINAFAAGLYTLALTDQRPVDLRATIFACAGLVYLISAPLLQQRKMHALKTLHLLFGLTALNSAIWMKWTGTPVLLENLAQLGILVWAGLKYEIKAFRWFAMFLAVVCFFQLFVPIEDDHAQFGLSQPRTAAQIALYVAVLCLCTFLHRRKEFLDTQGRFEKASFKYLYYSGANLVALALPCFVIDSSEQKVVWILQAVLNLYSAILLSNPYHIFVGICVSIWAILALVFQDNLRIVPTCAAAALCYALFAYTLRRTDRTDKVVRRVRLGSAIVGNLIITRLLGDELHKAWLSLGWAVEGIVLVIVGFSLRQRHLRVFGLCVLALVALKLLFVDLSAVGTLERIFSFIVAGLVFLGASYAYSWYTQKIASND